MPQEEIWRLSLRLRRLNSKFELVIERDELGPYTAVVSGSMLYERIQELLNNHLRSICNSIQHTTRRL